ncbi:hypothetical protein ANANG_G00207550 [Anguilla anguilla]|uniref:Uncharacterized protein n=1 Tax=Anguilla anguilla TaxID=7936 RepID=A0A9D3RR30_ANGAN|nr:hypothetical protein ANANG_G00207550 [Anguilla anguilla]
MADKLASTEENLERILAVESFFGSSGKPLKKPGRVLVGEGCLMKLCRRSPQPRIFFLFNDILVYGSIIVKHRWYASQQVIQLEDMKVEDLEDSPDMKNQWLVRTPRKSFYVSAASPEEKHAWITHIEECRAKRLNETGQAPGETFAPAWVPDSATDVCMRCRSKFTVTQRRHHCRQCGYVVCDSCSNYSFLIPNISCKPVRVCLVCHPILQASDFTHKREDLDENSWSDESSSDEDRPDLDKDPLPQQWVGEENHVLPGWSSYSDK